MTTAWSPWRTDMDDIYTKKARGVRLLLHPAQDLRVLPLPQDRPPGGLQLPVLLLPAVYPGQQVRRQLQVPGKRRQGLLRLPAAPRSGQLQLHQVQVPGTHGAGQEKPIRKETAHAVSFFIIIPAAARGRPCRRNSRPDSQWAHPSARWSGLYAPSPVSHLPCQPASALWCRPKT